MKYLRTKCRLSPFSVADKEGDKKSQKMLQELENIDDECEEKDIDFVKISDDGIEKEYDLPGLPALAFYRHKFRQVYSGDMMHEEAILEWILELRTQTPDVIENVDRKTLQVLINDVEHLAVFFCKSTQPLRIPFVKFRYFRSSIERLSRVIISRNIITDGMDLDRGWRRFSLENEMFLLNRR